MFHNKEWLECDLTYCKPENYVTIRDRPKIPFRFRLRPKIINILIAKTYAVCVKLQRFEVFSKFLFNYQSLVS